MKFRTKIFVRNRFSAQLVKNSGIEQINGLAFADNSLETIIFPNSVKYIGDKAFLNSKKLKYVELKGQNVEIGSNSFQGCISLETIILRDGISTIGPNAFSSCSSLKSITIPSTVSEIGYEAFRYCYSLETVKFSEGLKTINSNVFQQCYSLKSISLPNSLEYLGSGSFLDCISLKSIRMGNITDFIGNDVFANCNNLDFVYYNASKGPNGCGYNSIFSGSKINYAIVPSRFDLKSFRCNWKVDKELLSGTFKNGIQWHLLNESKQLMFFNAGKIPDCDGPCPWDSMKTKIEKIVIDNEITSIGNYTFKELSMLTNVKWNNSVTHINIGSFKNCTRLAFIDLPIYLKSIGDYAFVNCYRLTEISLPPFVETIGKHSFENCFLMERVYLNERIKIIPDSAFKNCTSLKKIVIPKNVTQIFHYAFYKCEFLELIVFTSRLKSVEDNAFSMCSSLKTIVYLDSSNQFDCSSKSFTNSSSFNVMSDKSGSVTSFCGYSVSSLTSSGSCGTSSYYYVDSMRSTVIFFGSGAIENFYWTGDSTLNTVIFCDQITSISVNEMFGSEDSLKQVFLSKSLTSIPQNTFYRSGIEYITIPETVKTIGYSSFAYCFYLRYVEIGKYTETIESYAFFLIKNLLKLKWVKMSLQ